MAMSSNLISSFPRKREPSWAPAFAGVTKIALLATASLALGACNTAQTHIGDEDPGIGEAVKYNAAIQTINPAPVYAAGSAQPGSNGDLGASAVKRYRTDKVKPVETMQTTSGSSSGGGSGGTGMSSSPH
jgi:hypothetical protein